MDGSGPFDWSDERAVRYVGASLPHFNRAKDASNALAACELLFKGLEQVKDGYGPRDGGEISAFTSLIQDALPVKDQQWLVARPSLHKLADFEPLIQNGDVLRSAPDYGGPGSQMSDPLRSKAEKEHRQFRNAHCIWQAERSEGHRAAVLKKLGILLYEVRSHITHGVKQQSRRDHEVAEIVLPVLREFTAAILGFPSRRLAVYGTLRRDGENHDVLSGIQGSWHAVQIGGLLFESDGLPALTLAPPGSESGTWLDVELLEGSALVDEWPRLDEFEGSGYRRCLAVVTREDGSATVAYVYEHSRESEVPSLGYTSG